jgi:hypothetical protein
MGKKGNPITEYSTQILKDDTLTCKICNIIMKGNHGANLESSKNNK